MDYQRANLIQIQTGMNGCILDVLFIPCLFLQLISPPTNSLNKIKFIIIIKTNTCFDTRVPSSGFLEQRSMSPRYSSRYYFDRIKMFKELKSQNILKVKSMKFTSLW